MSSELLLLATVEQLCGHQKKKNSCFMLTVVILLSSDGRQVLVCCLPLSSENSDFTILTLLWGFAWGGEGWLFCFPGTF